MKLSTAVSIFAWSSTFALAWLMISNRVPATSTTWFFFVLFLVVACVAGLIPSSQKPRP